MQSETLTHAHSRSCLTPVTLTPTRTLIILRTRDPSTCLHYKYNYNYTFKKHQKVSVSCCLLYSEMNQQQYFDFLDQNVPKAWIRTTLG